MNFCNGIHVGISLLFALTAFCFMSRKELSFNSTDTDIHGQKRIDKDCLTAEVLQLFVLDSSQQCQRLNKDGIAEANSNVPEADCEANIVSYKPWLSNSNLIVPKTV